MNWTAFVANIASKIPIERILFPPRDEVKSLEKFASTMTAPVAQNKALPEQKMTPTAQEPPYIPLEQKTAVETGTSCTMCSDEHFSRVSGALSEALRFARDEGLASKEVIRRVRHARDELNAMERFDLAPEEIVKLPEDEKKVAHWALPKSKTLRHTINAIRSVDDLEQAAAKAANTADEFANRLIKLNFTIESRLSSKDKERIKKRAEEIIEEV